MTSYLYSPSTGGFHFVEPGAELPGDGIAISAEEHAVLIDRVSQGWRLAVNDGRVEAIAPPPLDLESLRAGRIAALRQDCAAAIIGGYWSDALGAPHSYPSSERDQLNLMGSVTASLLPGLAPDWSTPFWCRLGADDWDYRPHSAAAIQQVGRDGKAHIVACQTRLGQLSAAVAAAAGEADVDAIRWEDGR